LQGQTTTEIFWIAGAALTVFGTALAALAIKREWVRVLSAVLMIIVIVALRVAL
jgi:predicted cobalt transporter CbtA